LSVYNSALRPPLHVAVIYRFNLVFFFFQAEDGIRDRNVTGVQTCALPILHSYRELPIRYGEFGSCHRNEPSGSLHGLLRVRGFTQDDGHIFCTEDQLLDECKSFTWLLQKVYAEFGFDLILYQIATRTD